MMIEIRSHTREALQDARLQANLRKILSHAQQARRGAVQEVENWEELRNYASRVKAHTLSRLDVYLEQLEAKIRARGGQVLWAADDREAVEQVVELARRHQIDKIVKSKTMLGEEIHLNEALEREAIVPVETDLGEYIVQLAGQTPSHIVAPALHMSRRQVAELFTEKLGTPPTDEPSELTAIARRILRDQFLSARMGITGVNFAVAETGTLVVVENEGNARLSMAVPGLHVALMGIEKVIPRTADLSVFLKLLVRSSTGQRMTSYINFISGPRADGELDGPEAFYLILVDNGRSGILQDPHMRQTLACIRCGACLNACPVFQRIGGHAYASTYSGPIGAILTPQLLSPAEAAEHPFASSLCGACQEVCPVKIEIPEILLRLRQQVQQTRPRKAWGERWGMKIWAWLASSPRRFNRAGRWIRRLRTLVMSNGRLRVPLGPLRQWQRDRDLPRIPDRSFREEFEILRRPGAEER